MVGCTVVYISTTVQRDLVPTFYGIKLLCSTHDFFLKDYCICFVITIFH